MFYVVALFFEGVQKFFVIGIVNSLLGMELFLNLLHFMRVLCFFTIGPAKRHPIIEKPGSSMRKHKELYLISSCWQNIALGNMNDFRKTCLSFNILLIIIVTWHAKVGTDAMRGRFSL